MSKATAVLEKARKNSIRITTAESCTGGLVAAALTDIAGSSDVFDRGFVTYSDKAKTEMLGVPEGILASRGAVSQEVAIAMAEGALAHANVTLSVAVTGIAGPGGGTAAKPVGLVYIASAFAGEDTVCEEHYFTGNRAAIRLQTVEAALSLLLRRL